MTRVVSQSTKRSTAEVCTSVNRTAQHERVQARPGSRMLGIHAIRLERKVCFLVEDVLHLQAVVSVNVTAEPLLTIRECLKGYFVSFETDDSARATPQTHPWTYTSTIRSVGPSIGTADIWSP